MTNSGRDRKSISDVARDRAAVRDVVPGVAALVALQVSLIMLDPDGRASAWNLVWCLLPVVPAAWLVWSQLRGLRRADEFQRVLQLEAMAIGFATMMLLSFAGGLLDAAGIGSARQSLQVTFIAGTVAWVAALTIKTLRAR